MTTVSPEVAMVFRLRDETSAGLAQINERLVRVEEQGTRTAISFRRNTDSLAGYSRSLLLFGATALSVASSVARLGRQFGLLNEEQEESLSKMISTIGAISALAGGLARLIPLILAIARAERTRAILGAIASVVSIPYVGVPLAIAAGAVVAALTASYLSSHQTAPGQRQTIPGPTTQSRLAMVHGGEVISRPSQSGGGGMGEINVSLSGPFMGSESEARSFARKIGRYLQEEKRIGGLTL